MRAMLEKSEIAKLELREGDILVVKVDSHLTQENIAYIKAQFEPVLKAAGHTTPIMVLDRSLKLEVVSKAAA
jgi:hypothetical protein